MSNRITHCRACGAEIMFIKTCNGKSMPVNAEPVAYTQCSGGNQKIITPNGEVLTGELTSEPEKTTGFGYISHFATCTAADRFRKPRKSDRQKSNNAPGTARPAKQAGFIDIGVSRNCVNPDSYGYICVKCNQCGRFDARDDGGKSCKKTKEAVTT